MTLPTPDLVVPCRIGPVRSARIADWLDERSDFEVFRRHERSFMGIKVETSFCRNLVIRTDDPIDVDDAVALLRRTLRRVSTHRIAKGCYARIGRDLACIADLAQTAWVDDRPWSMIARTSTPFGRGGIKGWTTGTGPTLGLFGITPMDWCWDPPHILCVHGDRDVTLTYMQGNAEPHDDPMSLMRSLARARSLIDDPDHNPWILPTDETPR